MMDSESDVIHRAPLNRWTSVSLEIILRNLVRWAGHVLASFLLVVGGVTPASAQVSTLDADAIRASPWVEFQSGATFKAIERLDSSGRATCLEIMAGQGAAGSAPTPAQIESLVWVMLAAELLHNESPLIQRHRQLVAVGALVGQLSRVVETATIFQDFSVRLGVHGVIAYATGGLSVPSAVASETTSLFLSQIVEAPRSAARDLALAHLNGAIWTVPGVARTVSAVERAGVQGWPIGLDDLSDAWADLYFTELFGLPMARFLVATQPETSLTRQLNRLGIGASQTAAGYAIPPIASEVVSALLAAGRYWEILALMGDAGAELRREIEQRREEFLARFPPPPGITDTTVRTLPIPALCGSVEVPRSAILPWGYRWRPHSPVDSVARPMALLSGGSLTEPFGENWCFGATLPVFQLPIGPQEQPYFGYHLGRTVRGPWVMEGFSDPGGDPKGTGRFGTSAFRTEALEEEAGSIPQPLLIGVQGHDVPGPDPEEIQRTDRRFQSIFSRMEDQVTAFAGEAGPSLLERAILFHTEHGPRLASHFSIDREEWGGGWGLVSIHAISETADGEQGREDWSFLYRPISGDSSPDQVGLIDVLDTRLEGTTDVILSRGNYFGFEYVVLSEVRDGQWEEIYQGGGRWNCF